MSATHCNSDTYYHMNMHTITSHSKRITGIANRTMKHHGALSGGFSTNHQKESKAWNIIIKACQGNKQLTEKLTQLESNLDIKNLLVNYDIIFLNGNINLKSRETLSRWANATTCIWSFLMLSWLFAPVLFFSYISLLSEFQHNTHTFYKLVKMNMKDTLKKISLNTSSILKKTSTMKIDKNAIEEKALVEREAAASSSEGEEKQ
ncbi:hypothetical protein BDR06DRAFT_967099 [Suillus hirtellus]|nr:hypothetical protein BDR06DRAFT_967099 [Suillus hirtellus]